MKILKSITRRSVTRGVTAAVAGLAASILAASPASAEWAPLTRNLWLASAPTESGSAYMARDIYLAAGNYTWTVSLDNGQYRYGYSEAEREIYLAAGTYHWVCSVTSSSNGMYQNACSLDAGYGAASLQSRWYYIDGSRYYNLSSYLSKH
ncbi:hypothetical protein AB0G79_11105 [Streptomyces sp. NPDC020807]|uniref:hypothetical protein n=1 Tax=Streptomyces sp. NPDC020807 TaxID=3155119 RepID=UPI0033E3AC5E